MRPRTVLIATVVVFAAIGSAAGSASAKNAPSDKALLKAGVLVARDLPRGWKSRPVSLGTTNTLKGVTGCEEQSPALDLEQRRAPSRGFYDPVTPQGGIDSQASNVARVFKNAALADQFLSAYKAASAAPCLQQTNESEFKRRNPNADVALTNFAPLSGFATIGDDSVGYGGVITASTTQQGAISGPLDLIYVRVGRAVLGFKLILQGEDPSQLTDIISHPVERVAKAQR